MDHHTPASAVASWSARLIAAATLFFVGCGHPEEHDSSVAHDDDLVLVAEGDDLTQTLIADGEQRWRTGSIAAGPQAFNRVGFRFDSEWTPAVELRVSKDGGAHFGEWQPAQITWNEGPAHNGHADVPDAAQVTHVQLRFHVMNPRDIAFLAVNLFEVSDAAPVDAEPQDMGEGTGELRQGLAGSSMGMVTRAQWGARATSCSGSHLPNRITVHHTVTPNNDSMSPAARMRQIQSFHIFSRKWCDIGYHFLIGQDGRIYQGRPERQIGAHVGGSNAGNAGISFVGNYMGTLPSSAMLDAGAKALRAISREYKISLNRDRVRGHRQYGTTSCPGDRLYGHLSSLLSRATNNTPAPPPPPACTQDRTGFNDIGCHPFRDDILWLAQQGIAGGCGNGNYCPDALTSRGQMATFVTRALKLPAGPDAFTDDNGHPHEAAINAIAAAGIVNGCGPGKFCPNDSLTRGQVAVILARAARLPAGPDVFSDDNGSPYEASINAIAQVGFTHGCATGRYCPSDAVTRGQLAPFLRRLVEYHRANCGKLSSVFTDIGCSPHRAEIEWMAAQGLSQGCGGGAFCPDRVLSRGETATLLQRALVLPSGADAFTDDDGSVHEPAINALAAAGITNGCAPGLFCPQAQVNRAQFAGFLGRALSLPAGPAVFTDVAGHPLEAEINALAAAGITQGCAPNLFCPADALRREQAAVFLHRAFSSP